MVHKFFLLAFMGAFTLHAAVGGKKKLCAAAIWNLIEEHQPNSPTVQLRIKAAVTEAFGDDKFKPSDAFMKKVYDYFAAHTEFLKLDRDQQAKQLSDLLDGKGDLLSIDEKVIMKAYLLEKNMSKYNFLYDQDRYNGAFFSAMKKLMRPENYNPLFLMGADKILNARELQLLDYKWNVGLADVDIAKVLPRGDGQEGEMHRNQVGVAYKKAMRRIRTAFWPLYLEETRLPGEP